MKKLNLLSALALLSAFTISLSVRAMDTETAPSGAENDPNPAISDVEKEDDIEKAINAYSRYSCVVEGFPMKCIVRGVNLENKNISVSIRPNQGNLNSPIGTQYTLNPFPRLLMNFSDKSFFIDAKTGEKTSADSIKEGDSIYVYFAPQITKSSPPQSYGIVIITNADKEEQCPFLVFVNSMLSKVKSDEDYEENSKATSPDVCNLVLLTSENTPISDFATGNKINMDAIKDKSLVLAWLSHMTMSNPALAPADRVVVLSEAPEAK